MEERGERVGVKLANTAGFCMGVKRAMEKVLAIAQETKKGKIYTYGPLIHNPQTVELLRKRGIIPVDDLNSIPKADEAIVVIRTHGITPEERRKIKERGWKMVDLTCPKVARVQAIIKKYARLSYPILIVGDRNHPEVKGLLGYAGEKGMVIENKEEALKLPPLEEVIVVSQTTEEEKLFQEIGEIIKKKATRTHIFNTICESTTERQKETRDLAAQSDALVIVGGKNSANTRRLKEIAENSGKPVFFVETTEELDTLPVENYGHIGVTAGASTPNWIIDRVVGKIADRQARKGSLAKIPVKFWLFLVRTDIYAALGAGFLYITSVLLQQLPIDLMGFLTASFFVYGIHTLNRLIGKSHEMVTNFREEIYCGREKVFLFLASLTLLLALILSALQGKAPFIVLLGITVLGGLYNISLLPKSAKWRRIKDIPGSKNISVALAWSIVTSVLPALRFGKGEIPGRVLTFTFVFLFVLLRSIMTDILMQQSDRFIGRETLPVILGQRASERLLLFLWTSLGFFLFWWYLFLPNYSLILALIPSFFYLLLCLRLCGRRAALSGMELWGLLETSYFIAGGCALLWYLGHGSV